MWISPFLNRSCPPTTWIKLKVVQEMVWRPWIWRWSSSALSAGGTAWATSRTKRSRTAAERPNTCEWFTSPGRLHFGHTTRPQIAGELLAPWPFFLFLTCALCYSAWPSDGLETDGYCWSDHQRRVDGFQSDRYHIPRTSLRIMMWVLPPHLCVINSFF